MSATLDRPLAADDAVVLHRRRAARAAAGSAPGRGVASRGALGPLLLLAAWAIGSWTGVPVPADPLPAVDRRRRPPSA